MKKFSAMLLALLLVFGAQACALTGAGYPVWNGETLPENGLNARFGDDLLSLEFDPAEEYSYIADGLLTACFFAFDSAQQNYLELYLVLPEDISAGDVFSSADRRGDSSISLYEVFMTDESLYFAGQMIGSAYPGASDYEITIETAVEENGKKTISGKLYATLQRIEEYAPADEFLTLKDCAFHFELPMPTQAPKAFAPEASQPPFSMPKESQFPLPEATPKAKFPTPTMDPHPAFTLPPDYRVI